MFSWDGAGQSYLVFYLASWGRCVSGEVPFSPLQVGELWKWFWNRHVKVDKLHSVAFTCKNFYLFNVYLASSGKQLHCERRRPRNKTDRNSRHMEFDLDPISVCCRWGKLTMIHLLTWFAQVAPLQLAIILRNSHKDVLLTVTSLCR